MKKNIIVYMFLVVLMALLTACAPNSGLTSEGIPRVVSVNGEGVVVLSPDMATISIGVQSENENAQRALDENNAAAAGIMGILEDFDISEEDIRTTNFSIYPRQNYNRDGEATDIVYFVQNTVLVTVRDLSILGDVLDAVVRQGANMINGITFDVADRESAYSQAMEAAMENARQRAETLVVAAGAELGPIQNISSYVYGGGNLEPYARDVEIAFADVAASVPVSGGQMEITVQVSAVFEIVGGN